MTSSTLAARICDLTHLTDRLEGVLTCLSVQSHNTEACATALTREIAILHDLLDALNLDYEEATKPVARSWNVGH